MECYVCYRSVTALWETKALHMGKKYETQGHTAGNWWKGCEPHLLFRNKTKQNRKRPVCLCSLMWCKPSERSSQMFRDFSPGSWHQPSDRWIYFLMPPRHFLCFHYRKQFDAILGSQWKESIIMILWFITQLLEESINKINTFWQFNIWVINCQWRTLKQCSVLN